VGEEVWIRMASKVNKIYRDSDSCKAVVVSLTQVIEILNRDNVRPEDISHALCFLLVMHQFKNGWTTEQVLQMFEYYVGEVEKNYESIYDMKPIGDA
jgi:hypothetical protein